MLIQFLLESSMWNTFVSVVQLVCYLPLRAMFTFLPWLLGSSKSDFRINHSTYDNSQDGSPPAPEQYESVE